MFSTELLPQTILETTGCTITECERKAVNIGEQVEIAVPFRIWRHIFWVVFRVSFLETAFADTRCFSFSFS